MTDLALRPRTSTELVDTAFQVYRRAAPQFLVAAALVYVPWLVLRLALGIGVSTSIPTVGQGVLAVIGSLLTYALVGGVTTRITHDVYFDQPVDVLAAFRAIGPRVLPLIAATLTTLAFIALAIFPVVMIGGALIGVGGSPALLAPIMFLAMLCALYPVARFFAVRQVVVLEDAQVGRALSRSSALSVDMKRHILLTLLLVVLLTVAITLGVGLLASLIRSQVVLQVVSTVASIVVYPFFGIAETLLYYDLRIRKEGFDIEFLASGGAPLATPSVDPF